MMRYSIILTIAYLLFCTNLSANLIPYKVEVKNEEYKDLENATLLSTNSGWNNNEYFALQLGFDFDVYGDTYKSINVKGGGVDFSGRGERKINILTTGFEVMLIDRMHVNSPSTISYVIDYEDNYKVLKIEWNNAGFIQKYSSSNVNDFASLQLWLFEKDSHFEIHFGSSNTDEGTFGHPEAGSSTGPYAFIQCTADSFLTIYGNANNPSYDWINIYTGHLGWLNSLPNEGTVYIIKPNINDEERTTKSYSFLHNEQEYSKLKESIVLNSDDSWDRNDIYTLDFDFKVLNEVFSKVNVKAGGGISFSGFIEKELRVYFTPFGGYYLKSLEDDQAKISYEIDETELGQILKVQWENAHFEQWYEDSSPDDFVDFQIWLFQSNGHIEIHFGDNTTSPGTYGYPDASSDPNPGPAVQFNYDNCSNVLGIVGYANNASYDLYDLCSPNYTFIDGTPIKGIVYSFIPDTELSHDFSKNNNQMKIFPNPVDDMLFFEINQSINEVAILDIRGDIITRRFEMDNNNNSSSINVTGLECGLYILKTVNQAGAVQLNKFVKK